MEYIECNDKLPMSDTFVDVIISSRLNPHYQNRKTGVAFIGGSFGIKLSTIEYVSHWMPIPKLPKTKFYDGSI